MNPFGAWRDEELDNLLVQRSGMPRPAQLLYRPRPIVQLSGPEGVGKTSLLVATCNWARQRGWRVRYCYVPAGRRFSWLVPVGYDLICVDEAERLAPPLLKLLAAAIRGGCVRRLLLGTHRSVEQQLGEQADSVQLNPWSAEEFACAYERRLRWAGLNPARFPLTAEALQLIERRSNGSCRSAFSLLYDVFQLRVRIVPSGLSPELVHEALTR